MTIEITKPGKNGLFLDTPVMPAAGTFGYGEVYTDIVNTEKLGAIVTNPVTLNPWNPASGTRVIKLDAGVLIHTGLPNPGLSKVITRYRHTWAMAGVPVIVHLVATTVDQMMQSAERLDDEDSVAAIELGLNNDIAWDYAVDLVKATVSNTEKPILVRLPLQEASELSEPVVEAGASTLVIAAPPRGTARDPNTGRLVSGRIYGPLVKPMVLRVVGQLSRRINIPIVGAGGIHSQQDARDYVDAGACAVQVDSLTWIKPQMLEIIGRDLGGWIVTRASGALADEWHPGMGDTEKEAHEQQQRQEEPHDAENPTGQVQ